MSDIIVTEVHSSIKVVEFNFNNFKDVSTTKQIPSKLEDALRIWCELIDFKVIFIRTYVIFKV